MGLKKRFKKLKKVGKIALKVASVVPVTAPMVRGVTYAMAVYEGVKSAKSGGVAGVAASALGSSTVGGGQTAGVFPGETGGQKQSLEIQKVRDLGTDSSAQGVRTEDRLDQLETEKYAFKARHLYSDYILTEEDTETVYFAHSDVGPVTITLPPVEISLGRTLEVKRMSATGAVTIKPSNGTIDDAASLSLTLQYEARTVTCDGTAWWIV